MHSCKALHETRRPQHMPLSAVLAELLLRVTDRSHQYVTELQVFAGLVEEACKKHCHISHSESVVQR